MNAPGSHTTGTRYQLELVPVPGNWRTPPLLRFRALLKAALRGYGFRCVVARPSTVSEEGTTQEQEKMK
jgi:hypothetical protein